MRKIDREALTRALALTRAESPGRARQIDLMLKDRPWLQVAQFASYCCQCENLQLKPWQSPPCVVAAAEPANDPQQHGLYAAWDLRRRLSELGLSPYEPDPLRAIDDATIPRAS
jgi:hypothetical protein